MKSRRSCVAAAALGFAVCQTPNVTNAMVSWTFETANCVSTVGPDGNCGAGNSNFSDGRTYQGTGGAGYVTVSGWANTTEGNTQLELGQITHYGGGLGVKNADAPGEGGGDSGEGSSPEHAVDNEERFDLVLFDFGNQLVELSQIVLGWQRKDSDISVLAYTGELDPTEDGDAHYIGDRIAYWNSNVDNDQNLTSHGWTLIGNHDVDDGPVPSDTQDINPNPGAVASNYWIVSSYNPVFGSNCTPQNSFCQSDYEEYFKIEALAGHVRTPDAIPEPAIALLLATALVFTHRVRARRPTL